MLNIKQEIKDYQQIDFNDIIKKEPEISDDMKSSIKLYNKAVLNLGQNSEDIAVIELKKAISLNHQFIDAINLLGICYLNLNDYEKAKTMFEKVLLIDSENDNALKYMNSIPAIILRSNKKEMPDKNINKEIGEEKIEKRNKRISVEKPKMNWKSKRTQIIARLLIALAVLVVIIYIAGIIIGALNNNKGGNSAETKTVQEYKTENDKLKSKIESLEDTIKKNNKKSLYNQNVVKLVKAQRLAKALDYTGAAELIAELKDANFVGADKTEFDALSAEVKSKTEVVATPEANASTYYEMGKNYVSKNDYKNAAIMFNKVINEYPNTQYAGWAKNRLAEISSKLSASASPKPSATTSPKPSASASPSPTATP